MNVSIRARLFVSASIILAAFLGITGIALDQGFHDSAETAVRDRLQAHVYTMLAAAELTRDNRLLLPAQLPEPRFSSPDSGLIADVTNADGNSVWKSKSTLGTKIPAQLPLTGAGRWTFDRVRSAREKQFIVAAFVASWAGQDKQLHRFRFRVAEDYRFVEQQVRRFRRSLWTWLGAAGIMLLAVQGSILRWSLSPLKQAETEIAEIETGTRKRLSADYPRELKGLTRRLNLLVENSEKHLQRYRDSLGNLAHSLKTPLAVLRNVVHDNTGTKNLQQTAEEQIQRMIDIVDHQLQRAATAGRSVMTGELAVEAPLLKLANALAKVYGGKAVEFTLVNPGNASFSGDEGDFFELAGNLMDNAFKWCRQRVRVTVLQVDEGKDKDRLKMMVDDDGPGIPERKRNHVLQRGERADAETDGQGLGLDMVLETVGIYNGSMKILENEWGGTRIEVIL